MKFAGKTDFIIIIALAAAALPLWAAFSNSADGPGVYAQIYYDSQLVKSVDLSAGREESFSLEQLPQVVFHLYADGGIAFIASDCPDQRCVLSGKLRRAGQMSACLPNRVYIKIVGREGPDIPDLIIGYRKAGGEHGI